MYEFLEKVSNLGQNVFACLLAIASREAFAVLEKPGGLPSRRVAAESQGAWLPPGTKGSPRIYLLGCGEGHRARLFAQ